MNTLYTRLRRSSFFSLIFVVAAAFALPALAALKIDAIHVAPLADIDVRDAQAAVTPTATQNNAAAAAGATIRWNRFGTPRTIINYGSFLATGLDADPVVAASTWVQNNSSLLGLSAADVTALTAAPFHVGEFAFSDARAVSFNQSFGGLEAVGSGMVTVGVVDGNVAMVTSSLVNPANKTMAAIVISPEQAIMNAAADAGFVTAAITGTGFDHEWTTAQLSGLAGTQRARLRSFAGANSVHPAYETNIVDNQAGSAIGYVYIVDANDGSILSRQNKVDQLADFRSELRGNKKAARGKGGKPGVSRAPINATFSGSYIAPPDMPPNGQCGPLHGGFNVPGPTYPRIVVSANAAVASNDIFVDLYFNDATDIPDAGNVLVSSTDVGFGEVVTYEPVGGLGTGEYLVQVCPLPGTVNPTWVPPHDYSGTFTFDDTPTPSIDNDARWRYFEANPPIDLSNTDIRNLGCWLDDSTPCDFSVGNIAARAPWDWSHESNAPTNTTSGNAAITGEAWLSPLTPAEQYRPVDANRNYDYPWTNAWYDVAGGCSPTNLVATTGNDIDAAIVNMFVAHNRMHDWSYYLGFTEGNSNAQVKNFGNTSTARENDPEVGNVQAGAVNGGHPSYLGRDNANQITLQDGVAPITNQYLWETIAGVIYVPCADGNYDMGIVGHEYGHMIQNRMTGGPAGDLGSSAGQGRRMGESWGDLTGMEIQNELGVVPTATESPYAIGAFVLGSPERGIRNYNMSTSPLNYSNMQYDPFGNASPHADGEIWSAINFDLRQAIWEAHLGDPDPLLNTTQRQRECAEGMWPPSECAGNRRWVQIMHDGFLLQGTAPSMLDARDAQLAGDLLRATADPDFGNHQDIMWSVYATTGMGDGAISLSVTDLDPTPSFAVPAGHPIANASVSFEAQAIDEGNANVANAEVFIGHFQARSNPVALTGAGPVDIAPGTYDMLARADGYGHTRFELTLTAGQTGTITINLPTNYASSSKGATATGDGADLAQLIDDTEATTWDFVGQVGDTDKSVVITLGGEKVINRVQVSALPEDGGNRFRALRQFAVDACIDGILGCDFQQIYVSSPDAFNGQPIRPLSPDLIMQSFDVPATTATKLRFRAIHNQCTGNPVFHSEEWAPDGIAPTTDCRIGVDLVTTGGTVQTQRDDELHAAEFQAFGSLGGVDAPLDTDADGFPDSADNCPLTFQLDQADDDADGVGNVCDNCLLVANADQCNTNIGNGPDQDQIGNICDADLNNDNIVNSSDLSLMRAQFGVSGANDADLNCDNIVNSSDLSLMRGSFGQAPGPSGIAP